MHFSSIKFLTILLQISDDDLKGNSKNVATVCAFDRGRSMSSVRTADLNRLQNHHMQTQSLSGQAELGSCVTYALSPTDPGRSRWIDCRRCYCPLHRS